MQTQNTIAKAIRAADLDRYVHNYAEAVSILDAVDEGAASDGCGFVIVAAREVRAACAAARDLNDLRRRIEDVAEDRFPNPTDAVDADFREMVAGGLALVSLAARADVVTADAWGKRAIRFLATNNIGDLF